MGRLEYPWWKKWLILMIELAAIGGTVWAVVWLLDIMGLI